MVVSWLADAFDDGNSDYNDRDNDYNDEAKFHWSYSTGAMET